MSNLQHLLDFENPTESSLSGGGKGPGGWYFHGGVQVTNSDKKFGEHSLKFTEDTGNLSKFNQTKSRLCLAGEGFTFSFFFKNIRTVEKHRTILQLCNENDPDQSASHLIYVTPDNRMGGTLLSARDWSDAQDEVDPNDPDSRAIFYEGLKEFHPDDMGLSDDEWHHMAVVGQGNETIIYIDGSPVCTYGVNPAEKEDNYLVVIGNRKDAFDPLDSSTQLVERIDYLKFYTVALSGDEIIKLMNECPGLVRLRLIS